jgi:hypothetical protein
MAGMRCVTRVLVLAALALTACAGDSAGNLSMEDAVSVAEAEVSPGGQETTADAEVDGLCAIVTFPGKPPVILTASDGAWAVVATSSHATYDPDERSCLGRLADG